MKLPGRSFPFLALAGLFLVAPAATQGLSAQTPLAFELVAEGLSDPLAATAPPGDERVFIAQHDGVIRIAKDGALLPAPFLDISAKVSPPPAGEAGFLGLAFHPDYADNGYFYVHYTDVNFDTVIERYRVSANPNLASPASARLVMFVPQPSAYHNGGGLSFGPDGYLYIGLGDGGGPLGPLCSAQDKSSILGKILRIDVDAAVPYAIPPTNPFAGVAGAAGEIWQMGLRNPWRFALDPLSGDLFIGDVGAASLEEIDYAPGGVGGLNFGWPFMEADACYTFQSCVPATPACQDPAYTGPILTASHLAAPFACAMVGGEVYRGCALPELAGRYFFTDYCDGRIRSLRYDPLQGVSDLKDHSAELAPFYPASMFITSFGVDGHGELLYVYQATPDLDGKVFRMVPAHLPAGVVDCDRNGFDDTCELAKDAELDKNQDQLLDVCQGLSASIGAISVAQGGQQRLDLHAGSSFAGRTYVLGGSLTGTSGILAGAVTIPLTWDPYTSFTVVHPNTPPLLGNLGTLSPAGKNLATFTAPAGYLPPTMVGLKLHHAFALVHPSGTLDYASNAIPLELLP